MCPGAWGRRHPHPLSPPPPTPTHPTSSVWGVMARIHLLQRTATYGKWKSEIQRVKTKKKMFYPDTSRYVEETNTGLVVGAKPLFAFGCNQERGLPCCPHWLLLLCRWRGDNPARPKASPVKGGADCKATVCYSTANAYKTFLGQARKKLYK